jgi:hypothetical protein
MFFIKVDGFDHVYESVLDLLVDCFVVLGGITVLVSTQSSRMISVTEKHELYVSLHEASHAPILQFESRASPLSIVKEKAY